eukprot:Rhum_TRINITY_DN11715_c1_g1::Rhum_TRINITY_DN11715_c1_g1_i1::g.46482::m.46482
MLRHGKRHQPARPLGEPRHAACGHRWRVEHDEQRPDALRQVSDVAGPQHRRGAEDRVARVGAGQPCRPLAAACCVSLDARLLRQVSVALRRAERTPGTCDLVGGTRRRHPSEGHSLPRSRLHGVYSRRIPARTAAQQPTLVKRRTRKVPQGLDRSPAGAITPVVGSSAKVTPSRLNTQWCFCCAAPPPPRTEHIGFHNFSPFPRASFLSLSLQMCRPGGCIHAYSSCQTPASNKEIARYFLSHSLNVFSRGAPIWCTWTVTGGFFFQNVCLASARGSSRCGSTCEAFEQLTVFSPFVVMAFVQILLYSACNCSVLPSSTTHPPTLPHLWHTARRQPVVSIVDTVN